MKKEDKKLNVAGFMLENKDVFQERQKEICDKIKKYFMEDFKNREDGTKSLKFTTNDIGFVYKAIRDIIHTENLITFKIKILNKHFITVLAPFSFKNGGSIDFDFEIRGNEIEGITADSDGKIEVFFKEGKLREKINRTIESMICVDWLAENIYRDLFIPSVKGAINSFKMPNFSKVFHVIDSLSCLENEEVKKEFTMEDVDINFTPLDIECLGISLGRSKIYDNLYK